MQDMLEQLDTATKTLSRGIPDRFEQGLTMRLYDMLSLSEKAGISVAVLDMSDPANPVPVRVHQYADSAALPGIGTCLQNGRIYLWFDEVQLIGLIGLTLEKTWIGRKKRFRPYFVTTSSPVMPGPASRGFESSLEWIASWVRAHRATLPDMPMPGAVAFVPL